MSELDTQKILGEASQTRNIANRGKLVQKAKRYLRFHERKSRKEEMTRIEAQLSNQNQERRAISSMGLADLQRYRGHLEDQLIEESPPTDLSGETRNNLLKKERELAAKIQEGMLTQEEMRRNPPGAVAKFQAWMRATKQAQNLWKNLRILNNPDSDDPDLANVEILRPQMRTPDQTSTFMPGAQIPGVFGMTPQAKANWPENMPEFGTINSPLKQAEEAEKEALRLKIAELEDRLKLKTQEEDAKAAQKAEIKLKRQEHIARMRRRREALRVHAKAQREAQKEAQKSGGPGVQFSEP